MTGRIRRPGRSRSRRGTRTSTTAQPPTVKQAQAQVRAAAQKGRPQTGATPGIGHNNPPRQYRRRIVRAQNGRFARDPNRPLTTHSRRSEYPHGTYSQRTLDAMATKWTDQGKLQGGVPRNPDGTRTPHDQLTWRDAKGREIPYYTRDGQRNLDFDHNPTTANHWNRLGGNNMGQAGRNAFHDNPDHLTPSNGFGVGGNRSAGARMRDHFRQDTGPDYSSD